MQKSNDPFLNKLYDSLHETPMQRKLRKIAPMPVGSVFLPWPGMTEDDARHHFRLMKKLGFTCLKQTMPTPEWPVERTLHLALDEGIVPFWYDEGGYEDITPELLKKLGLPATMPVEKALEHPKMIAYQHGLIRQRIGRKLKAVHIATGLDDNAKKNKDWVPSVVGDVKGHEIAPVLVPDFIRWLKARYGSIGKLKEAWNYNHVGIAEHDQWQTWKDVEKAWLRGYRTKEYRHITDALRFRAEMFIKHFVRAKVELQKKVDPHEPIRAGGEMGLFLSFASRGTDMEGIAEEMAEGGSFYPSIHLAWHFEEVDFEVARPVYMQAQIAHDWAKGIWSATWESTGGPQYFSGGKSPFVKEAQDKQPGFTVDAGVMTQMMLSYLAAGFKGFGLWAWNYRTAGWEGGEYALVDRNLKPNARTIRVGQIGQAARRYRRELWDAHKEPLVGIFVDWDNEATWAAMSVQGRDYYKTVPVRARIGASRAFINANVPWEYVTARNLRAGLAARYPIIYMPASLSMASDIQQILLDYVRQGGRVVLDMPGAYYDEYSRIFRTDKGTVFEQIFGCSLDEFSYSNPLNTEYEVDGLKLGEGFTCALTPTTARVVAKFKHNGLPAVTQNRCGKGSAVIIAYQASWNCHKPGRADIEKFLVKHTLGKLRSPYSCNGALVYRLPSPRADHYFLINDDAAKSVNLDTGKIKYRQITDAVTGEKLKPGAPIKLEGYGGRWLRMEK
jgi:beta-galactosidase